MGMRVGFDLGAGGGYVIVHKQLSLPLPENYAFTFYLRGEGRRNNFEFKLLDPTGKNVWWRNQRDFSFPTDWQRVTIRKSRLGLAWGPSKAREPKQVGAIELAISAGEGGSGSFWIDDLGFEEREPAVQDGVPPDVQASTSLAGHEPPLLLDEDPATGWKSDPVPSTQWVLLDFRKNREYGGLVIDWDPDDYATAFEVQASNDGTRWTTSFATTTGHGGRDYIYLPGAGLRDRHAHGEAVLVLRLAERLLRRDRAGRARGDVPQVPRRAADVLDARRRGRRRPGGAAQRGGHARGRQGGVLHRALPLRRRRARHLALGRDRPGAAGRLPPHPLGHLAARTSRPHRHGVRGRRAWRVDGLRALPDRQSQRPRRAGPALPGDPPLPGESALADAQRARGRDADPHPALRRARGVGGPRPGRGVAHAA